MVLLTGIASWASSTTSASADEPSYLYEMEIDNSPEMCAHMKETFNIRFQHLWEAGPLMPGDDPRYRAGSKYEFPKLPGVLEDKRTTFEMRYSKGPSSPEFDAIEWREGRVIVGGPKSQPIPTSSRVPVPMVVAYVDIDNDGVMDTVMKQGFNAGYSYMAYGHGGTGLHSEYLLAWRGERVDFSEMPSLWSLWNEAIASKKPVTENGSYLRPFVYKSHTYIAKYDMDLGRNYDATEVPPYRPKKETMSILDLRFTGASNDITHRSIWDARIVCRYKMKQIQRAGRGRDK